LIFKKKRFTKKQSLKKESPFSGGSGRFPAGLSEGRIEGISNDSGRLWPSWGVGRFSAAQEFVDKRKTYH
jgi:hypothetical protein